MYFWIRRSPLYLQTNKYNSLQVLESEHKEERSQKLSIHILTSLQMFSHPMLFEQDIGQICRGKQINIL